MSTGTAVLLSLPSFVAGSQTQKNVFNLANVRALQALNHGGSVLVTKIY